MMENTITHSKTFIVDGNSLMDTVRQLLSDGWRKRKAQIFFKERNNYTLEMNGENNPLWQLTIEPKTNEFDVNDWKLLQDLRRVNNLGNNKYFKKLYVNEKNKTEILTLINTMKHNNFNLIFNNDYIVFRTKRNKIKIFKVAAAMDLIEQPDGWYVGQKRIL